MKPVRALFLLGSNLGDRARHLRETVKAMRRWPGGRVLSVSRVYETAPVGPGRRKFLNQAVAMRTARTPMGLLLEAKRLEAAAGRKPGPRWGDRPLDVDLIEYGGARVKTPWLALPHPRARQRAFALAPLAELEPSYRPRLAALKPLPEIVKLWRNGR